jgi:type I restriction enzyme S subunit
MTDKPVHPPLVAEQWPIQRRWRRLDDLCLGVFDCPHSTPAIIAAGPLVVRSQDIREGVFKAHEAACVSEETYRERIARAEPRFGDILYSREGTYFGIAAEVPPRVRVCLGQRMVLIRPDPTKLNARFLRLWLNSPTLSGHLHGFRDGTVAERLNMPTIRGLPVPVFPPSEQDAIASILGALDDKIELNRRMNETLEAMARAIFQDWFVTFGPTRAKMEGRPPYLAPDLWSLFPDRLDAEGKPEGWAISTVGQEFRLTMGQSPPGETYNASGNGLPFFQGRTDFGFRYPKHRIFCTAPTRRAEADDTLISVRAPVGDLNLARETCCIGRGVAAARHRLGSRSYTYYALWAIQPDLTAFEHTGTVFGAINKAQFELLKVIAPDDRLLAAFETIATPMDDRIQHNEEEISSLIATRDLLLPRLMSGELRVKDAERIIETAA